MSDFAFVVVASTEREIATIVVEKARGRRVRERNATGASRRAATPHRWLHVERRDGARILAREKQQFDRYNRLC